MVLLNPVFCHLVLKRYQCAVQRCYNVSHAQIGCIAMQIMHLLAAVQVPSARVCRLPMA